MKLLNRNLCLSENKDETLNDALNFIESDEKRYTLRYLNPNFKSSKGGNSSVFLAVSTDGEELVVKISNIAKPSRKAKPHIIKRYGRFIEEIEVLKKLKEKGKENVVQIHFDGILEVEDKQFPFYVMEKASTDLKEYIFTNKQIDDQEKVKFCISVYNAINQLHDEGYYHRDIKPDNILLFLEDEQDPESNAIWKIGDLGLINHRDKDYDDLGEKVGPFGWLSPEAANKFLTEKADLGFDCKIDAQSDVFQLGKLFWFIFQGNIPIGQLKSNDFISEIKFGGYIFSVIESMLVYSKSERLTMKDLGELLSDLKISFAI